MLTAVIRILLMCGIPIAVLATGGYIIENPKSRAAQALQKLVRRMRKMITYILSLKIKNVKEN